MDAGGESHPHSPRGDRAVEIQALWITALESGAAIAGVVGRKALAEEWRKEATRAREAFGRLFSAPEGRGLFDHLDPDGTPDERIRPNQIFALTVPWTPILGSAKASEVVAEVRERCVLKHGVASLDPEDPDFHARHLDLERYHFDEAYHNGDVWVWLTGPVVSAFVSEGLVGAAWQQTKMLSELFYDEGAAGTLPELRNGVPPESGENVAGAVSQAWSLAEFLRNFYQDYLGITPDLLTGRLVVEPSLPDALTWVRAPIHLGGGTVDVLFAVEPEGGRARFDLMASDGLVPLSVEFRLRVPPWDAERTEVITATADLLPGSGVSFVCKETSGDWSVVTETTDGGAAPESGS